MQYFFCCTIISCSDDELETTETDTDTDEDTDEGTDDEPEPIGTIFTVDSISYYVTSSTDRTCDVTSSSPKYSGDIVIPSSVEYNNLTYSVTGIGYLAFYECTALTSVTIPNSVTTIGDSAFGYCTSLTSVTIGNSVETIDEYAFVGCTNLTEIYSKNATPPTIESTTFDEVDKTACSLYVPTGSMEAYSSSDYWDEFSNMEEIDF